MYKIISDGTHLGTQVINTETNKILEGVQKIEITMDIETLEPCCKIYVAYDMPFEITLKEENVEIKVDNKD